MGYYKYLRDLWKKPRKNLGSSYREDLRIWRREESIVRVEKPYNLASAKRVGYKAKQGFVTLRVKIKRGGRKREQVHSGRKPKKSGRVKYSSTKSLKLISEERTNRKYPNLAVLNSYELGKDGQFYYYEIISLDPLHPRILTDNNYNKYSEAQHRKRALRGLTHSGRKMRGLRKK